MAIKRIIKIEKVGRLTSCGQRGPEFSRYNLIFGENGRGKTTICAVLRSVQSGRPEYILERRTLGQTDNTPRALIRLDSTNASFDGETWDRQAPELMIYDGTFVTQNVFSGDVVERSQKTNLLNVVIGAEGVDLANEIVRLDEEIRTKNADINRLREVALRHVPKGVPLETFLVVENDPSVQEKIEECSQLLTAARRRDEIIERPILHVLSLPDLPTDVIDILQKSIDGVSTDAKKRIRQHLAKHKMDRGEEWLAEGAQFIDGESCPFCGLETAGNLLVDAYSIVFSEEYQALETDVEELADTCSALFGADSASTLQARVMDNARHMEFWQQFVALSPLGLDYEKEVGTPLAAFREALDKLIQIKTRRPATAIASDEIDAVRQLYAILQAALNRINSSVHSANATISSIKSQVERTSVSILENSLRGLRLIEARHNPDAEKDCDNLLNAQREKIALDQAKASTKDELDIYADKMMRENEAGINSLLKGFGTGFSLVNSKKSYVGGTATSNYQLLINNEVVELGDAKTPPGEPSFRSTLSSGDRSALALAFFLTQVDRAPNKQDLTVILDDPFSSQDRSRRERTAELIKKVGTECQQVLVLSHDPYFLNSVYSRLPPSDRLALQLSRAANNSSTIEEWDPEKECRDGYFRDHAVLVSYTQSSNQDRVAVVRCIRPVLEGYLRYRFPGQFANRDWLGDMISDIRIAGTPHPLWAALSEIEAINDYSKQYHHDTNPGNADSVLVDDGELQAYIQRTLAVVGGY